MVDLKNLICNIVAEADVGCAGAGSEEEGYHLTRDFVIAMMEHFRRQKTIHRRYAFQIILEVCCTVCCAPVCKERPLVALCRMLI